MHVYSNSRSSSLVADWLQSDAAVKRFSASRKDRNSKFYKILNLLTNCYLNCYYYLQTNKCLASLANCNYKAVTMNGFLAVVNANIVVNRNKKTAKLICIIIKPMDEIIIKYRI